MKTMLLLTFLASLAALGNAQTSLNADSALSISAQDIQRQGATWLCRGDVEIAAGTLVLHADEMDYHLDSGEAELRGNVRIKLHLTIKANCEGTGCISADSEAQAMSKIREAMSKMLAAHQEQTAK